MSEPELVECTWKDYVDFVEFCSVPTLPFHGGKCWKYAGGEGFIGYTFVHRRGTCRRAVFPEISSVPWAEEIRWCNQNLRLLSRVMVRPEFRRKGLAHRLINETKGCVGVRFIECLTRTPAIGRLLESCGFVLRGEFDRRHGWYYVYDTTPSLSCYRNE